MQRILRPLLIDLRVRILLGVGDTTPTVSIALSEIPYGLVAYKLNNRVMVERISICGRQRRVEIGSGRAVMPEVHGATPSRSSSGGEDLYRPAIAVDGHGAP